MEAQMDKEKYVFKFDFKKVIPQVLHLFRQHQRLVRHSNRGCQSTHKGRFTIEASGNPTVHQQTVSHQAAEALQSCSSLITRVQGLRAENQELQERNAKLKELYKDLRLRLSETD